MGMFRNLVLSYIKKAEDEPEREIDDNGYIIFKDPEVERVLMSHNVGDGVGIKPEHAAAVAGIGTWFAGNELITSFNEFKFFTKVTSLNGSDYNWSSGAFNSCVNLEEITFPPSLKDIQGAAFNNCTNLHKVSGLTNVERIRYGTFYSKKNFEIDGINHVKTLNGDFVFSSTSFKDEKLVLKTEELQTINKNNGNGLFAYSNIYGVILLGTYTSTAVNNFEATTGRGMFAECKNLHFAVLGNKVNNLGERTFYGCSNISFCVLLSELVPTMSNTAAFYGTPNTSPIYVRDELLNNYKSTDKWSSTSYNIVNRLTPISQFRTDFPTETEVINVLDEYGL